MLGQILFGMESRVGFRRLMGMLAALALAIQVLIPFIVALDLQALSADPAELARHIASTRHLHLQNVTLPANAPDQPVCPMHQGPHSHAACPLCAALAASAAMLVILAADDVQAWPLRHSPLHQEGGQPPPGRACPASYLSRAPPLLV
jgi:hypothetical protein